MSSDNSTVPVAEVLEHLRNWSFAWNIILTLLIVLLQYGNFKYSKILYGLKMAVLWLLWPLVIALSITNSWADFNQNWAYFGLSIFMLCVTLILWIMYFAASIRLYRRTHTFWAFNPETDAIIVFSVYGKSYSIPVIQAPTGITFTVLGGTLLVDGIKVATGVRIDSLPQYVTVAKATTTIIYHRVGKAVNEKTQTGWLFYVRTKHGDYAAHTTGTGQMTESEKLLHLV
nr:MAG: M protein [Jingmen bat alphacoronavirus 2]